jgi:hypothetical protein
MMWFGHGVNAERTVMQAEFSQNTAFNESVQGLVDGRQRDTRYLLANDRVDLLRTGVAGRRHQRLVNHGALMSDGETMPAAQFPEFGFLRSLLHSLVLMRCAQ